MYAISNYLNFGALPVSFEWPRWDYSVSKYANLNQKTIEALLLILLLNNSKRPEHKSLAQNTLGSSSFSLFFFSHSLHLIHNNTKLNRKVNIFNDQFCLQLLLKKIHRKEIPQEYCWKLNIVDLPTQQEVLSIITFGGQGYCLCL